MTPSRDPTNAVDRKQFARRWWSRSGAPVKRRPTFRPALDPVEVRCLLSSYNVPVDLGTLGDSNLQSSATAINTNSQVVGSSQILAGDTNATHPFLWTAGATDGVPSNPQMKDLGSLPGATRGYGWASDINDSGQVVGWGDSSQVDGSGNPIKHAFLWQNGSMLDLQVTYAGMQDLAINNSGVVVGDETTSAGRIHAFIWDQTHGARDLNDLVPASVGELGSASINNQGQIAANAKVGGTEHAYLLSDNNHDGDFKDTNEVTDLGRLGKSTDAAASAINDVGQIAGVSGGDAFLWQNQAMKNLGKVSGQIAYPSAINLGGYVVGSSNVPMAWVWTSSGKIKDLSGLIPRNSGWNFYAAWGINGCREDRRLRHSSFGRAGSCLPGDPDLGPGRGGDHLGGQRHRRQFVELGSVGTARRR